jgi:site-specific recombinase XerD
MKTQGTLFKLLQAFFTDRLMQQRQASAHTIAGYRDCFRLLIQFAHQELKRAPSALTLADLDADFLVRFLNHLERERDNSARTRNARLAAIHSFFRYVALHEPTLGELIARVLAIPSKRFDQRPVDFLTTEEIAALLAAPDQQTWQGGRDHALLQLAVQTGLRVSELTSLRCQDIVLRAGAHVHCLGKGRKERCTPLRKDTVKTLRRWLKERKGQDMDPLFPNARGGALSADGVQYILAAHVLTARRTCTSLTAKRVSPHVLRHTAAMQLLQNGVDCSVIALWLGHEKLETVQAYLHADPELKEKALARTTPSKTPIRRYRPDDELLAFLKTL